MRPRCGSQLCVRAVGPIAVVPSCGAQVWVRAVLRIQNFLNIVYYPPYTSCHIHSFKLAVFLSLLVIHSCSSIFRALVTILCRDSLCWDACEIFCECFKHIWKLNFYTVGIAVVLLLEESCYIFESPRIFQLRILFALVCFVVLNAISFLSGCHLCNCRCGPYIRTYILK